MTTKSSHNNDIASSLTQNTSNITMASDSADMNLGVTCELDGLSKVPVCHVDHEVVHSGVDNESNSKDKEDDAEGGERVTATVTRYPDCCDGPMKKNSKHEQDNSHGEAGVNVKHLKHSKKRVSFPLDVSLLAATTAGEAEEVIKLLREGANPDAGNHDGLRPLHQAAIDNRVDLINILLDSTANINVRDNEGWTPLHGAASNGHIESSKLLLERGADLTLLNTDNETAIDCAEEASIDEHTRQQLRVVFETIARKQGITAEKIAKIKSTERIKLLELAQGIVRDAEGNPDVELNLPGERGATMLHVATCHGYNDVVEYLLNNDADVNVHDDDGMTPLHVAVAWGHVDAVLSLVGAGADITAETAQGERLIDLVHEDDKKMHMLITSLSTKAQSLRASFRKRPDVRRGSIRSRSASSVTSITQSTVFDKNVLLKAPLVDTPVVTVSRSKVNQVDTEQLSMRPFRSHSTPVSVDSPEKQEYAISSEPTSPNEGVLSSPRDVPMSARAERELRKLSKEVQDVLVADTGPTPRRSFITRSQHHNKQGLSTHDRWQERQRLSGIMSPWSESSPGDQLPTSTDDESHEDETKNRMSNRYNGKSSEPTDTAILPRKTMGYDITKRIAMFDQAKAEKSGEKISRCIKNLYPSPADQQAPKLNEHDSSSLRPERHDFKNRTEFSGVSSVSNEESIAEQTKIPGKARKVNVTKEEYDSVNNKPCVQHISKHSAAPDEESNILVGFDTDSGPSLPLYMQELKRTQHQPNENLCRTVGSTVSVSVTQNLRQDQHGPNPFEKEQEQKQECFIAGSGSNDSNVQKLGNSETNHESQHLFDEGLVHHNQKGGTQPVDHDDLSFEETFLKNNVEPSIHHSASSKQSESPESKPVISHNITTQYNDNDSALQAEDRLRNMLGEFIAYQTTIAANNEKFKGLLLESKDLLTNKTAAVQSLTALLKDMKTAAEQQRESICEINTLKQKLADCMHENEHLRHQIKEIISDNEQKSSPSNKSRSTGRQVTPTKVKKASTTSHKQQQQRVSPSSAKQTATQRSCSTSAARSSKPNSDMSNSPKARRRLSPKSASTRSSPATSPKSHQGTSRQRASSSAIERSQHHHVSHVDTSKLYRASSYLHLASVSQKCCSAPKSNCLLKEDSSTHSKSGDEDLSGPALSPLSSSPDSHPPTNDNHTVKSKVERQSKGRSIKKKQASTNTALLSSRSNRVETSTRTRFPIYIKANQKYTTH